MTIADSLKELKMQMHMQGTERTEAQNEFLMFG